jgi:hypothetical protein
MMTGQFCCVDLVQTAAGPDKHSRQRMTIMFRACRFDFYVGKYQWRDSPTALSAVKHYWSRKMFLRKGNCLLAEMV